MNLIVDGKLSKRNLLGYIGYTLFGLVMNICIPLNIYFAEEAGINVGLVTIIWRVSVFIGALLDYIYFKTKLKYYHFLGLILMVVCVVIISVDHMNQ